MLCLKNESKLRPVCVAAQTERGLLLKYYTSLRVNPSYAVIKKRII